jgi:hypothetical protein
VEDCHDENFACRILVVPIKQAFSSSIKAGTGEAQHIQHIPNDACQKHTQPSSQAWPEPGSGDNQTIRSQGAGGPVRRFARQRHFQTR